MEQRKEIDLELVKSLMKDRYHLIYVDYRDSLDDHGEIIQKCIEEKSAVHLHEHFNELYTDAEYKAAGDAVEEIKSALTGNGYEDEEIEAFFDEHEDEIRDGIYSRSDNNGIEEMLKHTRDIPVRIEMLSNYDCINSDWFESQGGYSYEESYFGDMVDALNLNPQKVKKYLAEQSVSVRGRFPNRKSRNGKEQVSYEDFHRELINSCCGANLLTYAATINPTELYEAGFNLSKITVPKGNFCGIFSSTYGGGSVLEMKLQSDVTIDLERTEYPQYRLALESEGKAYDYSIKQVYGICDSFYGKPLSMELARSDDRISA